MKMIRKTAEIIFFIGFLLSAASCLYAGTDKENTMKELNEKIKFTVGDTEILVALYDNATSRSFLTQLPAVMDFEDYSGSEKITYPSPKLSTAGAPAGTSAKKGDLCLYAPWGDLCFFYRDFGYAGGLVPVGYVVSGLESLTKLEGAVSVTVAE